MFQPVLTAENKREKIERIPLQSGICVLHKIPSGCKAVQRQNERKYEYTFNYCSDFGFT